MTKYQTKTAKLYNAGLELNEALKRGADSELFNALEIEFKGGSIPVHLLHGFKYVEPYSCDYHKPKMAVTLQNLIKGK